MMDKWRRRFAAFMAGRYGTDSLGRFLIGVSLVILVIGIGVRRSWPDVLAFLGLIICYFRMFSKNVGKRRQEELVYEALRSRFMGSFHRFQFRIREKKKYHIYRCPKCGQKIRIPRGKGKISVSCPKCSTDFVKRS